MNKKTKFLLAISLAIIVFLIGKAFILNESVKVYLIIFFFVGLGLAMLRLLINGMMKRMRGKHMGLKLSFFVVLLGLGIPFQNWFRTDVLLAMNREYLIPCIIMTVVSVVLMTVVYGVFSQKKRVTDLEQNTVIEATNKSDDYNDQSLITE